MSPGYWCIKMFSFLLFFLPHLRIITIAEVTNGTTSPLPTHLIEPKLRVMQFTNPREFPHQVYVEGVSRDGATKNICSASIIHPLLVLTAAYCAYNVHPPTFAVVTGESITSFSEGSEQWLTVRSVIIHEDYNANTLTNNIAILVLEFPIKPDNFTKVINIAQPNQSLTGWAYVSGWSIAKASASKYKFLQKVGVAWVGIQTCRWLYRNIRFRVTYEMLCAEDGGKNDCTADSGSPLTCVDAANGQNYLCGMFSWGYGCGLDMGTNYYSPKVYTDLRKYHGWIQGHIQQWSGFYLKHFFKQPHPNDSNGCESRSLQLPEKATTTWWQYLWG